jgi:hypothetical protein
MGMMNPHVLMIDTSLMLRHDCSRALIVQVYAGVYDESTRDYGPFLVLPAALKLLRWLQPQALRDYCMQLCSWGTAHLCEVWGTPQAIAPELCDTTARYSRMLC